MTRRQDLALLVVVGIVALVVRLLAAGLVRFPIPEDTAYYVDVARNLLAGRGLVADALWSYQTPPLVFPRPAFEVWLPLPSLLAALPMAVAGAADTRAAFAAAQLVPVAAGVVVAVLAAQLGREVAAELRLPPGRARTLALGAGLTAAVYLPLILHSALPDSTMLFAVLALAACLGMARLLADPRGFGPADRRLLGLGLLLGLAALTRNEALWLALTWLGLVAIRRDLPVRARLWGVGTVAAVSLAVFAPWAARDWLVFGTPLPGQALANALSVTGFDIFAWQDQPSLGRYLALGPERLLELRLIGLGHNLLNVLVLLGIPLALPWTARILVLRPLVLFGAITFAATSLLFPVATTWGTFLHAAGPVHVLLVLSALVGLDRLLAAVGRRRGWTRPVAWLGSTLTVAGSLLFSAVFLPGFGVQAQAREREFGALRTAFEAVGTPLGEGPGKTGPVITNFPIWLAYTSDAPALALPDEPPEAVVDLAAAFPGTRFLVVFGNEHGRWPAVLEGGPSRPSAAVACFEPLDLTAALPPAEAADLAEIRAWRIVCPAEDADG